MRQTERTNKTDNLEDIIDREIDMQPVMYNDKQVADRKRTMKDRLAVVGFSYFYQNIIEESTSFSPMVIMYYLLNGSLTTNYYSLTESFGSAGLLGGTGTTILIIVANYISARCTLETVARVEMIIKSREEYSGKLVLKTRAFISAQKVVQEEDSAEDELESALVKPQLDERTIEFAELVSYLFPNAKLFKISLTSVYQMFQTFAIYWYVGIMIFQAADQIKFLLAPDSTATLFGLELYNIIGSAFISTILFMLCLMTDKAYLAANRLLLPVKLVLILLLLLIMAFDLVEWKWKKESMTRNPAQRGDFELIKLSNLYLPISWLYSTFSTNNLLPGAISMLQNKNYTSPSLLRHYHVFLGLLIIIGGSLYAGNFGNSKIVLYKHFADFDSGFHEIEPLWAYLVAKLLALSPIYFVIAGSLLLH